MHEIVARRPRDYKQFAGFGPVRLMISRRSTKRLAELLLLKFSRRRGGDYWVPWDPVYDFLYERDFDAQFCNAAEQAASHGVRAFEEFILRLHTGESVAKLRVGVPVALEVEGQAYLRQLAEALLKEVSDALAACTSGKESERHLAVTAAIRAREQAAPLTRSLELDGYLFRDGRLLHVESAIVDVDRQHSALLQTARDLQLGRLDVIEHHLQLSEEHFEASRWDDCIGNARKFLECCLQESAAAWSVQILGKPIEDHVYVSASETRDFLRKQGLLTPNEFNTLRETYGLLSETGNHPHIAANDQARMLRQVALIYSEFAMLRLKGALGARKAKS